MTGSAVVCPTCRATIPPREVAEGWCESCGKRIPQFALSEAGVKVADRVSVPKPTARSSSFDARKTARNLPAVLLLGLAVLQVAEGLSGWLAADAPRFRPDVGRETLGDLVNKLPAEMARNNLIGRLVGAAICVFLACGAIRQPRLFTLIALLYLPLATLGIQHGIQFQNSRELIWESTFAGVIVAAVIAAWVFGPRRKSGGEKPRS
jgi:hypothetical protein